eukprot:11300058-Heterocapsa_arctica.AAC.1
MDKNPGRAEQAGGEGRYHQHKGAQNFGENYAMEHYNDGGSDEAHSAVDQDIDRQGPGFRRSDKGRHDLGQRGDDAHHDGKACTPAVSESNDGGGTCAGGHGRQAQDRSE